MRWTDQLQYNILKAAKKVPKNRWAEWRRFSTVSQRKSEANEHIDKKNMKKKKKIPEEKKQTITVVHPVVQSFYLILGLKLRKNNPKFCI